jgi:broad specificity phosphatase PhoE
MAGLHLTFLRHGHSLGNTAQRMEGRACAGLSDLGQQQATALGQHWSNLGLPSHCYCSPQPRAAQTLAAMLSAQFGPLTPPVAPPVNRTEPVPVVWRPDLQEYDNGIFQNLTWAEASQRYPDLCQQLMTTADWLPIPQAESLAAGRQRAQGFIDHVLHTHRNGDWVWVVTHSWILQQLVAVLLGCDRTWELPIDHTGLFEFALDCDRWNRQDDSRLNSSLWQIRRFNHRPHLAGSCSAPDHPATPLA